MQKNIAQIRVHKRRPIRCILIKGINYVPFKRPLFGAVYFFVLFCFSKEQSKMNQKRSKKCEYPRVHCIVLLHCILKLNCHNLSFSYIFDVIITTCERSNLVWLQESEHALILLTVWLVFFRLARKWHSWSSTTSAVNVVNYIWLCNPNCC